MSDAATNRFDFWATPDDLDFAYDIGGIAAIYKGPEALRYAELIADLPALHAERDALKAQRDELLKALKGTVFLFENHAVTRTDMEQLNFARAAINKVEQQ